MRVRYTGPTAAKYIQYYQKGESLPHFRGDIYGQRGAGVGSIFAKVLGGIRGLISSTPQWIKTGVKEVAKQAAKTGMDIISDAARAKSRDEWQKTAKQKLKASAGDLLGTLGNKIKQQQQEGKGIKRRRKTTTKTKPNSSVKRRQQRKTPSVKKQKTKIDFLGT